MASILPPVDPNSSDPYPFTLKLEFAFGPAADSYTVSVADFPLLEDNSPDPAAVAALIQSALAANPDTVITMTETAPSNTGYQYNGVDQTIPAIFSGSISTVADIYTALGLTSSEEDS